MKESVKIGDGVTKGDSKVYIKTIGIHIIAAIIGFVGGRAQIFYEMSPFGVSFAAGCSLNLLPSVSIGVFLGYFIPGITGGFRYIAAFFAVTAIRVMLSSYRKLSLNPYFLSLVSLLASLFTSLLALWRLEEYALRSFAEGILICSVTFLLARVSRVFGRRFAGLTGDEMASLLIVMSIILIAFSSVTLYGISLGRIMGIVLIFISSKYGGTLSGAVSGITVTFSQMLVGSNLSGFALFSLGGMMAGIFSPFGRLAQIAAVSLCGIIGHAFTGGGTQLAIGVVELLFASSLFLMLPSKASVFLGKIFSCCPKVGGPTGVKKGVIIRLDKAASALDDVSKTVEQVAKKLSDINAPSFSRVAGMVEKDTCVGCRLRLHCWETKRSETMNALVEITKAVRSGATKPEAAADEGFKIQCLRLEKLGESIKEKYGHYAAAVVAENRMEEVRGVVSDQFSGVSDMLYSMSREFEGDDRFDNSAALTAAAALKNLDIRSEESYARIDRFGRMTLEFKIKKEEGVVYNKLQIMRMLSLCCERDFDVPVISESAGKVYLTVSERPRYTVDMGVCQFAANGSGMCGDAYRYFSDGLGRFFMILSDGMGTGGRAAVDGTFVSGLMAQLLKAGFGYNCSLKILNSSMLFKSTDESMATLDIACIDLFNGKTELLKAGAAPSLVRRSGKTGKAESHSLPVGILRDIGLDKATLKLKAGDIVILMSDGAVSEDLDWIRNVLNTWGDGSAQQLSETIAEGVRRRYNTEKGDDITVMAAIVNNKI
ncbi:MAG: SpoIIE family protein phosphatase [Clostridia bacterium]|nr:SpoIIE family protein phosphatase [Clostridia bacterium]